MPEYHKPVLVRQVLDFLDPRPGGVYLDATVGGGGHAVEVLERSAPDGTLIGIDRDPEALEYTGNRLAGYGSRVRLFAGNFRNLAAILAEAGIREIDGATFDLGTSSHQLDAPRGFSFMRDEPLDMRMNPLEGAVSAADIVNDVPEAELARIIRDYGEERYANRIAKAILARRSRGRINTTAELVDVIISAVGSRYRGQDIHPATRVFQSIRIRVNEELEAIEPGVTAAVDRLKPGGRVCVISFHSLEDRIVKNLFRRLSGRCECPPRMPVCQCGAKRVVQVLTAKPVTPDAQEMQENPRSRSSKLRCAMKLDQPV